MNGVRYSIFLLGATGFIGGGVLHKLLKNKHYHITALIKEVDRVHALSLTGVRVLLGNLDDTLVVAEEAYKADAVIQCADADHFECARAIVTGLRRKYKETGKKGVFLQTSGTRSVNIITRGCYLTQEIFHDDDPADIATIPDTNFHRDVDLYIQKYDSEYNLAIISPGMVYGHLFFLEGIVNPASVQIPLLIRVALANGRVKRIGRGVNLWSAVHNSDCARFYMLVLQKLLQCDEGPEDYLGYFFVENGQYSMAEIIDKIAHLMYERGLTPDTKVEEIYHDDEIAATYPGKMDLIGGNSRVKANKARKIGWTPKYGGADIFKTIEDDFNCILREWLAPNGTAAN